MQRAASPRRRASEDWKTVGRAAAMRPFSMRGMPIWWSLLMCGRWRYWPDMMGAPLSGVILKRPGRTWKRLLKPSAAGLRAIGQLAMPSSPRAPDMCDATARAAPSSPLHSSATDDGVFVMTGSEPGKLKSESRDNGPQPDAKCAWSGLDLRDQDLRSPSTSSRRSRTTLGRRRGQGPRRSRGFRFPAPASWH